MSYNATHYSAGFGPTEGRELVLEGPGLGGAQAQLPHELGERHVQDILQQGGTWGLWSLHLAIMRHLTASFITKFKAKLRHLAAFSIIKFKAKLRHSTAFSVTKFKAKLRHLTAFSITKFKAKLRHLTAFSVTKFKAKSNIKIIFVETRF